MIWGVDTEEQNGVTVSLVAANEHGEAHRLVNADGLTSAEMMRFLTELPLGLKVAFAFNYDATMILKHLPFSALNALREAGAIRSDEWRIRHIPGKRFWVSHRTEERSAQVWDVFSWYPTSFNKLLADFEVATPNEAAFILKMKARRNDFSSENLDEIVDYSVLECVLLARWVRYLLNLHDKVGLNLTSYCGPGSTASAIYRKYNWKPPERPEIITEVATEAFYGGRNEVSAIGEVNKTVYAYDIGSAYPFEISRLPGIIGWQLDAPEPRGEWWGFGEVTWQVPSSAVWGPFPMRGAQTTGGRSLSLVYPRQGYGVYHSSEILAAQRAYPGCVKVIRTWLAITNDDKPFAWVHGLAAERLERKANGDPAAYPLKVGLNSLYGKMVQRKGRAPYRDVVYGAAVTAGTRARLLNVLTQCGASALLAATDGVLTTQQVGGLDFGKNLGQWEVDEYDSAFIAQSGVYWIGDKIRTRGFRRHSLSLPEVKTAWRERGTEAVITYSERRFIGYRLATARGRSEQVGTWVDGDRALYLSPYPRRQPHTKRGHLLHTLPPNLADWVLTSAIDQAMIDVSTEKMPEYSLTLNDREDPEWTF